MIKINGNDAIVVTLVVFCVHTKIHFWSLIEMNEIFVAMALVDEDNL